MNKDKSGWNSKSVANKWRSFMLLLWYYIFINYTEILEVNPFAFAYRLLHEDFSPFEGTEWREIFMKQPVGKCKQINFKNLFVYKDRHWTLYQVWFQNKSESYLSIILFCLLSIGLH